MADGGSRDGGISRARRTAACFWPGSCPGWSRKPDRDRKKEKTRPPAARAPTMMSAQHQCHMEVKTWKMDSIISSVQSIIILNIPPPQDEYRSMGMDHTEEDVAVPTRIAGTRSAAEDMEQQNKKNKQRTTRRTSTTSTRTRTSVDQQQQGAG